MPWNGRLVSLYCAFAMYGNGHASLFLALVIKQMHPWCFVIFEESSAFALIEHITNSKWLAESGV